LLVLMALLSCAIVALADSSPIGEKPSHDSDNLPEGEKPQGSHDHIPEGDKPTDSSSSESICTALFDEVPCPKNTSAVRNTQCLYVCGVEPIGKLSYYTVEKIVSEYASFYADKITEASLSTLAGKNVQIQSPPESVDDYCIEVEVTSQNAAHSGLPDVFNGVRVVYMQYSPPDCTPMVCADGTMVACDGVCEDNESFVLVTPFTVVLGFVLLSACCCCLRRRKCRAKCQMNNVPRAPQPVNSSDSYPAQQYQLLQQEHEIPMHPAMGQPMMYPPMPVIPPQVMMPNGVYPVMMQAPNGMWYPAALHPEDV